MPSAKPFQSDKPSGAMAQSTSLFAKPHVLIPASTAALTAALAVDLWVAGGDSGALCVETWSMDMHMYGFKWAGNLADSGCVVLLFKSWTLDTRAKFLIAAVGTFLFAIGVELIGAARRGRGEAVAAATKRSGGGASASDESVATGLFAVHVTCGCVRARSERRRSGEGGSRAREESERATPRARTVLNSPRGWIPPS